MSMHNAHFLKVAVRPANAKFTTVIALALALLAPACGASDDGTGDGSDGGSGNGSCDPHVLTDGVWTTSSHANNAKMYGSSSATELRFGDGWGDNQVLVVRLYSGTSDFPSNPMVAPGGTVDLADNDDIATCGACVYYAFGSPSWPEGVKYYFATSGTLTVTSITPMFSASLKDVILTPVDVDANGAVTPSADGCEYTMASGTIYTNVYGAGEPPEPRTLN